MAIRKDYVNNMQFFLILIVCSVYQNKNASKKTIAKLKKCQKNFQDIYKRIAEPKQNNDVESKKDTKTFIVSQIDEEEKAYIHSNDMNDDEFVFEDLIKNVLDGKYHKYCSGWDLEAHICKNGQANCCRGNFIHKPIDGGFIEGNCTDFEFESSKDEINIKLIPFKEVEKQVEYANFCPKSLEIQSFRGSNLLSFDL